MAAELVGSVICVVGFTLISAASCWLLLGVVARVSGTPVDRKFLCTSVPALSDSVLLPF
jgi:hypothetical protein